MNATVMDLTARGLLGRRRVVALVALPAVLVLLAVLFRTLGNPDTADVVQILDLGYGTVVPLLGVIVGTGAIGPEIEDGSIVYLLSKPLSRLRIVISKLTVAALLCSGLSAAGVLAAGLIMSGGSRLVVGYAVGAAVAGAAYCAVFLLLAVVTRNAVVVGLVYALLWETTVAGLVPGAQALSVRQWALSITERMVDDPTVTSAVSLLVGVGLLVAVVAAATWFAAERLRSLSLTGEACCAVFLPGAARLRSARHARRVRDCGYARCAFPRRAPARRPAARRQRGLTPTARPAQAGVPAASTVDDYHRTGQHHA